MKTLALVVRVFEWQKIDDNRRREEEIQRQQEEAAALGERQSLDLSEATEELKAEGTAAEDQGVMEDEEDPAKMEAAAERRRRRLEKKWGTCQQKELD